MLIRFGITLYWAGCVGAVLWALISGYIMLVGGFDGPPRVSDVFIVGMIVLGPAVIIWLTGRGARYVLAGD